MKFVQIKPNGVMNECDETFNKKNIRKILRGLSNVKSIYHLYTWSYDGMDILCYGCYDGKAGSENKHDLPPNGECQLDCVDNSDTQLLFKDIFMVGRRGKSYSDLDVSDYGLFYNLSFQGFDDCCSDDETDDDEDSGGDLDGFIVNDNESSDDSFIPGESSDTEEYEEYDELDEDENEY